MKHIFIIGAGRSATDLIQYLLKAADENDWQVVVGDVSLDLARSKTGDHSRAQAIHFDATDPVMLADQVSRADLVISFLPPDMHLDIARACLRQQSHLLTASYVSPELRELDDACKQKGLIFLSEMGADPGIDHMGAMKNIDEIRAIGGTLQAFKSYCGALVAPESDDNPWGYKFTWSPMNIILAGRSTARYIENGKLHYLPHHRLFASAAQIEIPSHGIFEAYANRDSLAYRSAYGLENLPTLYRATLRKVGFCESWHAFVQLGLTDPSYRIAHTDQMTYREWLEAYLPPTAEETQSLPLETRLAAYLKISPESEIMERLRWTGILSEKPIERAAGSPAEILMDLLLEKLQFGEKDTDMLVMYDYFLYEIAGEIRERHSYLLSKGIDPIHTAISRTVGLTAAIGAKLILQNRIQARGVMIPTSAEIYAPVLAELEEYGIQFEEKENRYQPVNQT